MANFYTDDIISEGGITASTLTSDSISCINFSATTLNGDGTNISNITKLSNTLILSGGNRSIQFNNNSVLSGSTNFTYNNTTNTLSYTGTTSFNGLFYRLNSPSIKQVHQWNGLITVGLNPGIIWTNMPAGTTTWLHTTSGTLTNDSTFITDFTEYSECRFYTSLQIAGATINTSLTVQYSTNATTWVNLVSLTIGTSTGIKDSGWLSIPVAARTFVYIRLVGANGNATADPRFSPPILLAR